MTVPTATGPSGLSPAQLLRHAEARRAAEKFVGQTFFAPMLRQMRESPFKSELWSGGRGGAAFQSMFDGLLAERMGKGAGRKLVDAIVERIDPQTTRLLREASRAARPVTPPQIDLMR